jgi:hypothetical protein
MGSVLDVWSSWQTVGAAVAIVMSGVGVSIAAVVSPARRLIPAIVAGSVVATLALQYSVLAPQRPEPVERMAAMVLDARQSDEPYGRYRVFTRNLVFYTGVPHVDLVADEQVVAFLRSPGRVLCVLTRADLRRLTATAGVTVVELGEVSYVNLGNLKLRTFLRPNPSEDVQQVVLVANR